MWENIGATGELYVENYCAKKEIPLKEAMGVVDMDFASDPETVLLDELLDSLEERQIKAGVGEKAKMAIGIAWRSPDVSKDLIT